MTLYTMIYTAYCIPLSSDTLRERQVESMKINEQVKRPLELQMISNFAFRSLFPRPNT
jgi:hypothetical protein